MILTACADFSSIAVFLACVLCTAIGFGCGWLWGSPETQPPAPPAHPSAPAERGRDSERDRVAHLLAQSLPRLSARLSTLSSAHDLETEAQFVVDVQEALDELQVRVGRASVPPADVSEPIVFVRDERS